MATAGQESIVRRDFAEEAGVLTETKLLLGQCACGEDRLQLQADKILRLSRIDSLLDWYNENVLGITYGL